MSSLHIHSMDNKAGMITSVNYLSIVRIELPFFRFSRIFLPSYFVPVYILMLQCILQIKLYLYYCITQDTWTVLHCWQQILFYFMIFTSCYSFSQYLGSSTTLVLNAPPFWIAATAVHLSRFSSDEDLQVLDLFSSEKSFHFWMLLHIC